MIDTFVSVTYCLSDIRLFGWIR